MSSTGDGDSRLGVLLAEQARLQERIARCVDPHERAVLDIEWARLGERFADEDRQEFGRVPRLWR